MVGALSHLSVKRPWRYPTVFAYLSEHNQWAQAQQLEETLETGC